MPIMGHSDWMKRTKAGVLKPRSKKLKILDACLREYDTNRGSLKHFEALWLATAEWIKSKSDPENSVRNKAGAVTDLIKQLEDFRKQNVNPASHLLQANHLDEIRKGAELFKQGKLKPAPITINVSLGVRDTSKGTVVYEEFTREQLVPAKKGWADAYRCAELAVVGAAKVKSNRAEEDRFQRWFGNPSATGVLTTVQANLAKMQNAFKGNKVTLVLREDMMTHIVDGRDPFGEMIEDGSTSDVYGYVWVPEGGHVGSGYRVILGNWFLGDPDPIEGAAQTIYHELTHKVLNTRDHAYGKIKCRGLAAAQQQKAVTNADNYGFYAVSFLKAI